jgi:uncharacterized protein (TIGR03437 family)
LPVDGQVYAQPLYVSGLTIGGVTHNVLFVATQHNTVYAFDADAADPEVLWQVTLGVSVPATLLFGQYGDISNEVGILSTPVIDPVRGVIYVVTDNLRNGLPAFHLHALDLTSGTEQLGGPVTITASVSGSGSGGEGGTVVFDPRQHIQRPGLLLANGAIYVAFGSHGDQSPYHGWLISYDAGNLAQLSVYMSTPDGDGGAFWQSGRGPAADPAGNIYAITGNGDYDGQRNFGQSFLQLSSSLKLTGSFTPADWKSESDNDADLAAGPALIANFHTYAGADKSGNLYLLDTSALGQPDAQNGNAFQIFSVSGSSIFNFAVWNRNDDALLYIQGRNDPLKCFRYTPAGFNSIALSQSSNPVPWVRLGMTVSANGGQDGTGILWEITGNFNDGSNATLHAYDAGNLANELWNSDMNAAHDAMGPIVKFVAPTVANGRVYAPSLNNSVMVYGLFPNDVGPQAPAIQAVASAASYGSDALSPGEIVAVFGSNLGPATPAGLQLDDAGMVTTSLADTQVFFDGTPAPMVWTSAGQVNAVVPFGISNPSTQIQVQYQDRLSDPFSMPVASSSPGIFTADGSGVGQAIVLNQDGSVNSASNPAPAGSVIVLYATGAGQFNPPLLDGSVVGADNLPVPVLPVVAQVGGRNATILYAGGAPNVVAGVLQVNVVIPVGSPSGSAIPVSLRIGTVNSQTHLTIAVQ